LHLRAGSGNAARFPRPRATLPQRPVMPALTAGQRPTRRVQSARRGRVGRWPGALAPGWQGAAWRGGRGDGPCQDAQSARAGGRVSRLAVRQPLRPACLQHPAKSARFAAVQAEPGTPQGGVPGCRRCARRMNRWPENRKLLRRPRAVWRGPAPRSCAARATGLPGPQPTPDPHPRPPASRFPVGPCCLTGRATALRFLIPPGMASRLGD